MPFGVRGRVILLKMVASIGTLVARLGFFSRRFVFIAFFSQFGARQTATRRNYRGMHHRISLKEDAVCELIWLTPGITACRSSIISPGIGPVPLKLL